MLHNASSTEGRHIGGSFSTHFIYPTTILHPNTVRKEAETVSRHSRIKTFREESSSDPQKKHYLLLPSSSPAGMERGGDERKARPSAYMKASRRALEEASGKEENTQHAIRNRLHAKQRVAGALNNVTADVDCGAGVMALRKSHRVQRPATIPEVFPSPQEEPSILFRGFHPLRCPPHCVALSCRVAKAAKDPHPVAWERRKRLEQAKQDAEDTKCLPPIRDDVTSHPKPFPVSLEAEERVENARLEKETGVQNREHQFWNLQLSLQLIKRTNLYKLFVRLCDYYTRIYLLMQQADFIVKALENDVGNLQQPPLVLGYHPLVWMLSIPNANVSCKDLITHFTDLGGARNNTSVRRRSSVGTALNASMDFHDATIPGSRGREDSIAGAGGMQKAEGSPPPFLLPQRTAAESLHGMEDGRTDGFPSQTSSPRSSVLHYLRSDEDRAIFHLLSQIGLSHLQDATVGGRRSGAAHPHSVVGQKSGVAVLLDTLLSVMTKPPMKPLNLEEFHRILTDVSNVLQQEMILMQVVLHRLQERMTRRKNSLTKDFLRFCSQMSQPHVKPEEVLNHVVYEVPTELELLLLEYPEVQVDGNGTVGNAKDGLLPSTINTALGKALITSSPLDHVVSPRTMTVKLGGGAGMIAERTVEEVDLWFRFVHNFHVTGVSTLKVEHVLESVTVIMADVCAPLLLPECGYQIFGYNGVHAKKIDVGAISLPACSALHATRLPEDERREKEEGKDGENPEFPSYSSSSPPSSHEVRRERSGSGIKGRGCEIMGGGGAGGGANYRTSSQPKRIRSALSRSTLQSNRSASREVTPVIPTQRRASKGEDGVGSTKQRWYEESNPSFVFQSLDLSCALFALDVLGHDPLHVHHDLEFALEEIAQLLEYAKTLCVERRVENQRYREATCVHDQEKKRELDTLHSVWEKEMNELLDFMWKGELRVGNVHFIHSLLREHAPHLYKAFQQEHRIYLCGYAPSTSGETFSSLVPRYNPFRQRTASRYVQSEVQKNYPNNFLIMAVCHESLAQLKECENIAFWIMIKHYKGAMKAFHDKVKRSEGHQDQPIPVKGPLLMGPERMEQVTVPGYHLNEQANPLLLPHCSKAIQILSWLEKLVGYRLRHFSSHPGSANVPDWVRNRSGNREVSLSAGGRRQGSMHRLSATIRSLASSTCSSVRQGSRDDGRRDLEIGNADSTKSIMLRTVKGEDGMGGRKSEKPITQYGVMDCFISTDYNRQLYQAPENQK